MPTDVSHNDSVFVLPESRQESVTGKPGSEHFRKDVSKQAAILSEYHERDPRNPRYRHTLRTYSTVWYFYLVYSLILLVLSVTSFVCSCIVINRIGAAATDSSSAFFAMPLKLEPKESGSESAYYHVTVVMFLVSIALLIFGLVEAAGYFCILVDSRKYLLNRANLIARVCLMCKIVFACLTLQPYITMDSQFCNCGTQVLPKYLTMELISASKEICDLKFAYGFLCLMFVANSIMSGLPLFFRQCLFWRIILFVNYVKYFFSIYFAYTGIFFTTGVYSYARLLREAKTDPAFATNALGENIIRIDVDLHIDLFFTNTIVAYFFTAFINFCGAIYGFSMILTRSFLLTTLNIFLAFILGIVTFVTYGGMDFASVSFSFFKNYDSYPLPIDDAGPFVAEFLSQFNDVHACGRVFTAILLFIYIAELILSMSAFFVPRLHPVQWVKVWNAIKSD